jgi:ABC-type glycerol-3-phosphate transport system substrate-binding protein
MYSEEETGDPVNDAVYRRTVEIDQQFNIKLTPVWVAYGSQVSSLRNSVLAGDSAHDVVMTSYERCYDAAVAGLFADLAAIPELDLSNPWWDQNLVNETSVMNKVYYASGDISIVVKDGTWAMMFNKELHKQYGLPDVYEIVKNGEWTLDKLAELSKGVTVDLNGDGKIDKDDQVGFSTTTDSVRSFIFSTGSRIIKKDADDMPHFVLDSESAITNLEKIYDLFRGPDEVSFMSTDWQLSENMFNEGRALFYAEVMRKVTDLRAMDQDFGVLPLPKASSAQENHYTNIHKYASEAAAVPAGASVEEASRAGMVLEAMAYMGFKYMTPAYYDIALKSKYARDEESAEMLDIIFGGSSADLGYVGNIGNFLESLVSNVVRSNRAFASTIEANLDRINTQIDNLVEVFENLP